MTLKQVQILVAQFASQNGRQPTTIVSNQATHDALVLQLPWSPMAPNPHHKMSRWTIDASVPDDDVRLR